MKISVVGLGKLGSCMAAVLSHKGHDVVGVDVDEKAVALVNARKAPVLETGLQEMMSRTPFRASLTFDVIKNTEITFVIVPTPSDSEGRFSNRYLLQAAESIGKALARKRRYHLVVVCSTTMPGSMENVFVPALRTAAGKESERSLGVCYSPQFIALGSVIHDMLHPDMVLVGESSSLAGSKLARIFSDLSDAPICRMSLGNAEIAKLSVNAYITMKISFANTLAEICEKLPGGNATTVLDAIGLDSRIGQKYLNAGAAYSGPCFPRDSVAFSRFAEDWGVSADIAEATDRVNDRQTVRIADLLSKYVSPGNAVAILGLAYKPNTHITDESPGIRLGLLLEERGYLVRVYDPAVLAGSTPFTHYSSALEAVKFAQAAVVMTPWAEFRSLSPACFRDRPSLLLLVDVWGILEPWTDASILRVGMYNADF